MATSKKRSASGDGGSDGSPTKKAKGSMTKSEFIKDARPMSMIVGTDEYFLNPKVFSTGSCGWGHSGRIACMVGKKEVPCQMTANVIANGSKDWEEGGDIPEATETENKAKTVSSKGVEMTKMHFKAKAASISIKLGEVVDSKLDSKIFNTNSCGWQLLTRGKFPAGENSLVCQVNVNFSALNSKNWEQGDKEEEEEEEGSGEDEKAEEDEEEGGGGGEKENEAGEEEEEEEEAEKEEDA